MSNGSVTAPLGTDGFTRHMFGDRRDFGIECEVQDCELDPWGSREPFGSFWFWVGGRTIGNTHVSEQLTFAFLSLVRLAERSGDRNRVALPGVTNLDKLNYVIWLRWGEDHEYDPERWGYCNIQRLRLEDRTHYEVIPRGDSPWSDDWEAILLEDENVETFIWRRWIGKFAEVREEALPIGRFAQVVGLACQWFLPFRRARVGPERDFTGSKPRLAPRID